MVPFNSLFLSGNAEIKYCCSSRTILGNANKTTVEEAMNSNSAKEIRQYMLDGEWHPNCIVCKETEEVGGRSTRSQESFILDPDSITENDFVPEFLDLRWNNTCNLTCNYCISEFSNKWASIRNETVIGINKDNETSLLEYIKKNKNTIKKVMLLGGEPLLHKQSLLLADILPDALYYMLSNLSLKNLPNNANVQKFLTVSNFDWGVSFDCIGDKFEYVRHGANWDIFVDNLKYVQQKTVERGTLFSAHPLYGLYSAYNLIEYYDFVYENNLFHGGIWWQSLIHNSGGSINQMTKKMKDLAIREIEKCVEKYPTGLGIKKLIEIKEQLIIDLDKLDDPSHMRSILTEFDILENKYLTNKKYLFKDLWPMVYDLIEEGAK
jgi:MoaA/NifB/PqqE/SkfB family radical SAM enzyme